jgi:UDP-N-acetyl-D-galactosamine dehydrogenase
MGADRIRGFGVPDAILFDVKRALPRAAVDGCL